jgi:hypothetical protein
MSETVTAASEAFRGVCEAFFMGGHPAARAVLEAYEGALSHQQAAGGGGTTVSMAAAAAPVFAPGVPESGLEATARVIGLRHGDAGEWVIDADLVSALEHVKNDGVHVSVCVILCVCVRACA